MGTYIARRLLHAAVIMLGLAVFFFVLVHVSPQGPCDAIRAGDAQNAEGEFQACLLRYGPNKPLPVQFFYWASNVLHGDFGLTADGQEVGSAILARLPATVLLIGTALLLQLAIALPLGILGALQRYTWGDQVLTLVAYVFLSTPTFWLGILAILVFAVDLNWVPPTGIVDIVRFPAFGTEAYWHALLHQPLAVIGDLLHHLILPACVYAIVGIGSESRYMRASLLDVLHREYIRTARAKGLPRRVVIYKHALRNAVLPVVTNVGLSLPRLVAGSIIVESVFSWPGLGLLYYHSLTEQSYATLQALLLLSALAVLLGNLVTDLAYAAIDPRIRYDYSAP